MSTEIDEWIGAEVERSFASEPPLRDPREYAALGRRARSRRRVGAAATAVAGAVAVAALLTAVQPPQAGTERHPEPAGVEEVVPVTTPIPVDPHQARKCAAGSLGKCDSHIGWDDLHLDAAGRIVRGSTAVHVTGRYDHVMPDVYRVASAFELTVRGRTVWALLTSVDPAESSEFQTARPDPTRTFDEWVHDSTTDGSGGWFAYSHDPMIAR